jgi:hypothetical protein
MHKLFVETLQLVIALKRHQQSIWLVMMIAMFVMAAGAPNATIGIGK